jgi:hypothetical protein
MFLWELCLGEKLNLTLAPPPVTVWPWAPLRLGFLISKWECWYFLSVGSTVRCKWDHTQPCTPRKLLTDLTTQLPCTVPSCYFPPNPNCTLAYSLSTSHSSHYVAQASLKWASCLSLRDCRCASPCSARYLSILNALALQPSSSASKNTCHRGIWTRKQKFVYIQLKRYVN